MVHIVHGLYGERMTYCGLQYKASMPAITWSKPIEKLESIAQNVCSKCLEEKSYE